MKSKKVYLFSLAFLLLLLAVPAKAEAAAVAKIGSKSYSSISQAVSAVKSGQTIKIAKNAKWQIQAYKSPKITNKKVIMDLGGHTVTLYPASTVTGVLYLDKSSLTIKNGTLKEGGKRPFIFRAENNSQINLVGLRINIATDQFVAYGKGSGFTAKKVTLTCKESPYTPFQLNVGTTAVFSSGTYKCFGQLISSYGGTVTIKGGSYTYPQCNYSTSLISNGSSTDSNGKKVPGKLILSGGTLKSDATHCIIVYNQIGGSLKISGKTKIEGFYPIMSQGQFAMSGGTVHAVPYDTGNTRPAVDSSSAPKGSTVTLSGGTLISDGNAAIIIGKNVKYKNTKATLKPGKGYNKVIRTAY